MKKLLFTLLCAGLIGVGVVARAAQMDKSEQTSPKTVIHVVTVNFKADATPEQVQAAIDGVHQLPARFKGITHVWTKPIKNQTDKSHIFIMEFASEQALKDYAGSDAQKEWYKAYEGIRDRSTTFDVTN